MVNGTAAVLEPTYTGYVATTQDALILFEACLTGVLHHVPRRPHDRERSHLVRSGSIFIYEENSSGIKRWTDGVTWSPSRILGNFLVYRELDKPFPPGEKKRAMKKGTRRPVQPARPGEPYPRPESNGQSYSLTTPTPSTFGGDRSQQSDVERALVGSLVDSYGFKDSGLVKKTMSVTVSGVTHHLVSYYSVEDVVKGILTSPTMTDQLRFIRPRAELTSKQSFRAPIDDVDTGMENPNDPSQMYGYRHTLVAPPGYGIPSAHPDYYMHSAPYGSHPSQPASMSAYPSGPLPPHSGSNPYLPAPSASSHLPVKAEADHTSYRGAPYSGGYDSLSHNHLPTTIPPSLNNSSMPSSLSDRSRSQHTSSPTIYRNSSMSSRSIHTDATSPVDPSTSTNSYARGSFSLSGGLDPASNPSLEQRNVASAPFDPTVPRREPNPMPPSYYTGGGDRQNYYVGAAHSNYPTAQPISAWTTTAPTQPQM